ncbi:hypothetical protein CgunFtcFv8_009463 [Champsocephalus gunnari]|uniref:Uncharacterized protein n=1 Tax=Champsocephalus gunnari TaxID=52237 RepID=A0AAN8GXP6_CHAGU|nr:hypothetical protein CgunFtcFv8_009463 [Champsocephalus gunnari]
MDGILIRAHEVISVVCFSDVHEEFGQSLAQLLLLASPLLCEGGGKHKGGKERVHDIISPGLLRSSPVEG